MATISYKVQAYLVSQGKTKDEAEKIALDQSQVVCLQEGIETWNVSSITKPTDSELINADSEGDKLYIRNRLRKTRKRNYPSLQDQADMQYWDSVNGTTTWLDAINEIKTRYPKP